MLGVLELDHPAGIDVDQMVVVGRAARLVARAAAAEIPALEDALLLQQAHRAIDRRDRDARIERTGAPVELLHVGMIVGVGEHPRDDATLAGHLESFLDAQALDTGFHRLSRVSRATA